MVEYIICTQTMESSLSIDPELLQLTLLLLFPLGALWAGHLMWFEARLTEIGHLWEEPWHLLSNWAFPSFGFMPCSNVMLIQYKGFLFVVVFLLCPISLEKLKILFFHFYWMIPISILMKVDF